MKCLIVEDSLSQRMDYDKAMREAGFECFSTASTSDAQYYLRTHTFDVLLLDLNVEDGSTLPIADYLEIVGSESTIILVTGSGAFPNGESAALSPRIDYVLRKPINISDLKALVAYACEDR